ncbi:hypothetical protein [Aeoliella mucimassa]|uniref:Uncharacterized protein n=1 Tax=Aeoliella mucimassa TaxID=2527972 RepID=A0A518ATY2_9BACT|nr:hypothetical protein [Aeoliella mucimassa]QDU58179.1 hypothetical protein Pan181_44120 [Aeoliella mucimassa]
MMATVVPRAHVVGHDLLEAAKPLALLGWIAPALITARLALESALREIVADAGCEPKHPSGIVALVDAAVLHDLLPSPVASKAKRYAVSLNRVAHGKSINLQLAVGLIESIEHYLEELRSK